MFVEASWPNLVQRSHPAYTLYNKDSCITDIHVLQIHSSSDMSDDLT